MRADLVKRKLAQLQTMVNDLERNVKVIYRIGGVTHTTLGEEIAFQQARIDNLTWVSKASDKQIRARIARLEGALGADVIECKYGSVRGLPLEQVQAIAMVEDLEISLGVHPAVKEAK